MTICTNCNGEGLVGSGEKPWMKQGKIVTCPECSGTGQMPEAVSVSTPEPEPTPVDNTEVAEPEIIDTIKSAIGL